MRASSTWDSRQATCSRPPVRPATAAAVRSADAGAAAQSATAAMDGDCIGSGMAAFHDQSGTGTCASRSPRTDANPARRRVTASGLYVMTRSQRPCWVTSASPRATFELSTTIRRDSGESPQSVTSCRTDSLASSTARRADTTCTTVHTGMNQRLRKSMGVGPPGCRDEPSEAIRTRRAGRGTGRCVRSYLVLRGNARLKPLHSSSATRNGWPPRWTSTATAPSSNSSTAMLPSRMETERHGHSRRPSTTPDSSGTSGGFGLQGV